MNDTERYAVVTPYHKEEKWLLERCIRSVQAQTVKVEHFMIADGHPQDWLDREPVRHIRLDREHRDYGNTPRTIGALLAVSEGYDGIGLLDADNWFENDHVASCIAAAAQSEACDYVIARRNLCRPDGSVIDVPDYSVKVHVDTSCFFLLPGSYHCIPHLALTPIELSPICDQVFYSGLKAKKLQPQIVEHKTVNYHCLWDFTYRSAGETPPSNAKPIVDATPMKKWLSAQSPRQMEIIRRRVGYKFGLRVKAEVRIRR